MEKRVTLAECISRINPPSDVTDHKGTRWVAACEKASEIAKVAKLGRDVVSLSDAKRKRISIAVSARDKLYTAGR